MKRPAKGAHTIESFREIWMRPFQRLETVALVAFQEEKTMVDHFSVRMALLCIVSVGSVACAIGGATPGYAESRNVPVLSGTYLFNAIQNCLPGANDLQNITGTMTFDPKTGKMSLFEYVTSGNPLTLQKGKGTQSYSNSADSFTLGTTTFPAFYGKRTKGIATSFSFIGLIEGGCALQASLTLR